MLSISLTVIALAFWLAALVVAIWTGAFVTAIYLEHEAAVKVFKGILTFCSLMAVAKVLEALRVLL